MAKKRIYEVAKELGIENKIVVKKAQDLGFDVKSHMSSLDDKQVSKLVDSFKSANTTKPSTEKDSKNSSRKEKTKIKVSVGAIRRRDNKNDHDNRHGNNKRRNNKFKKQQNDRRAERNKPQTEAKSAARDLLNKFKKKQRAEASELNAQTEASRRKWHQEQNPQRSKVKKVENTRKPKEEKLEGAAAVKARVQASQKPVGPKIIKPSPARNKAKRPTVKKVEPIAPVVPAPPQRKERPLPETLVYEEGMNAQDLGKLLHREPAEIVKKLFMLGVMTNQNQSLDKDTIELLAAEYGIEAQEKVHEDISDIDTLYTKEMEESKASKHQEKRPPVVTIMGHVDHGKTTLLDRLRHTNVSEHEAGGITQKIGAYQVRIDDRLITFLDTPGHAAFSNMRARGAEITDIVVLVVAADDGVMPQTIEAIDHAKSAGVPIIVAVNKIDKPGANPDHVMEQLMKYGLVPEDWGGDTIFVKISAKTGKNVEELLQMILLQADVMELKADPDQKAIGTVIEARLDKGRGSVADVLVQQGTLKVGDPIVVGDTFGRVRVMTNDKGRRVKKATPSAPVEITGLNDVPEAADKLVVFEDEKTARSVGEQRAKNALEKQRENVQHVTLDNLFDTMKKENMKEVDIVLKADVQGSAEALQQSLEKIEVEGVRVNIIHSGVGAINESDVTLAGASNAFIVGFNVRPTNTAKSQADAEGVDIRLYNIIYKVMDDVEAAMKGMLEPTYEEKVTGNLTVRETWKVSKIGTIAGAFVDNGYVTRDSGIRVIRDGIVKYDGKVASLKRFKDDVKEVKQGFDCGITIENFNDIKVDDQLEAYEMQEVPVK